MSPYTAGPESLEDYFQKGALSGSKSGTKSLVLIYQAKFAKTVHEHLKAVIFGLSFFFYIFSFMLYSHNSIVSFQ